MGFGQLFFDIYHFFDQLIFDTVKLSLTVNYVKIRLLDINSKTNNKEKTMNEFFLLPNNNFKKIA